MANAERFVTPELSEHESQIASADERRVALELALFERAARARWARRRARLQALAARVAAVDVLAALAEVAHRHGYVRPVVDDSLRHRAARTAATRWSSGWPPRAASCPTTCAWTPTSEQLLLVTGPNMAGKSTLIRQVALAVVLAQMGGFVPGARGAHRAVRSRLHPGGRRRQPGAGRVDLPGRDARDRPHPAPRHPRAAWSILDEIGRGTSTYDGVSIAWAVAEHLHDVLGARTLFATHYHELCALAETHPRVRNVSVAAREWKGEVVFLRKLTPGGASRSFGVEVARLAGLPAEVVARARAILATLEGDGGADGARRGPAAGRAWCGDLAAAGAVPAGAARRRPAPRPRRPTPALDEVAGHLAARRSRRSVAAGCLGFAVASCDRKLTETALARFTLKDGVSSVPRILAGLRRDRRSPARPVKRGAASLPGGGVVDQGAGQQGGGEAGARASRPSRSSRGRRYPTVVLYHVNRRETLRLRLYDDRGRPVRGVQRQHQPVPALPLHGKRYAMNPRLIRLIYETGRHYPGRRIEVVSGYRHPKVAKNPRSPHMKGLACDLRVVGVKNTELRDFFRSTLQAASGVGYYPNSSFVHLDVRKGASAFWIDYSGPGENAHVLGQRRRGSAQRAGRSLAPHHHRPVLGRHATRPAAELAESTSDRRRTVEAAPRGWAVAPSASPVAGCSSV